MTPEVRNSLNVLSVQIPCDGGGFLPPSTQSVIKPERNSNDKRISSAVENILSPRPLRPGGPAIASSFAVLERTSDSVDPDLYLLEPVLSLTEASPEKRINIDDLVGRFLEISEKSNEIISGLKIYNPESLLEGDEYEEDEFETSSDTCFHLDISESYLDSQTPPIRRSKSNPNFSLAGPYFRELMENDKKELQILVNLFLKESYIFLRYYDNINEIVTLGFLFNGIDSLDEESFEDPELLKICLGVAIDHLKSIISNEDNEEIPLNNREILDELEGFQVPPNTPTMSESTESSSDDSSLSEEDSFLNSSLITAIWNSVKNLFINNN